MRITESGSRANQAPGPAARTAPETVGALTRLVSRTAARRAPVVMAALASMAAGAWLGLVRLGWNLPLPWPDQLIAHGPLMVCAFLGTLVGLERAIALGSRWGYAAPALAAAGGVALILDVAGSAGRLLTAAGSLVLVAIFLTFWRRHLSLSLVTMTLGAAAWVAGNVQWLRGASLHRVVFWWLAFLLLTIAGERLELNRFLGPSRAVRSAFVLALVVLLGGVTVAGWWPGAGVRMFGVGLIGLTWWLARHDIARRTVRQPGLPRFMALCLIGGYAWLGVAGIVAAVTGVSTPGLAYDALLHAVFLGFAISMVFAHAPVIFPAILQRPLPYRPAFYLHVGVLHLSLGLRIAGDLVDVLGRWRAWGGLLNVVALLLFVVNTVRAIAQGGNEDGRV